MGMQLNRWWWATVVMTSTATGDIITVDDNALADFTTIHEAIAAADEGDEILVAPGHYSDVSPSGFGIINPDGKAITIRATGAASETIIDGNHEHHGVYCNNEETNSTIIEGFTITNGNATIPWNAGGGILCVSQSNPLIRDCIITGNRALYSGGGIACFSSSPTIEACDVTHNLTTHNSSKGGGLCIAGASEPTLSNLIITNNSSGGLGGGGIWCDSTDSLTTLIQSTISLNTTLGVGGGIYVASGSGLIMDNCTVSSNDASGANEFGFGGGLWSAADATPELTGNTLCGNWPDQIEDNDPSADDWDFGDNILLDACGVDGACCVDETCSIMFEGDCQLLNGEFLGGNTNCNNDPCVEVPFGACCLGTCTELNRDQCLASDGTFLGDGTTCDEFPCSEVQPVVRWHHLGDNLVDSSTPHWTVDVYIELPTGYRLDAVAGNPQQALSISTTGSFYQENDFGGNLSKEVNDAFYPLVDDLEWDSRFGIGCIDQGCDGAGADAVQSIGFDFTNFEAGSGLESSNASWFILSDQPQGTSSEFMDSSTGQIRNGVRIGRLTVFGLDSTVTMEAFLQGREADDSAWQSPTSGVIERESGAATCDGDLNTDGMVGLNDLELMIEGWDTMGGFGDLDADGTVGIPDLLLLLSHWGPCES